MKIKNALIALSLTLSAVGSAHAATDITGEIYGDVFQMMTVDGSGTNSYGNTYDYGLTIDDISQSSEDCDSTLQVCYIKGVSWSDTVGWTLWDGTQLQSELGATDFPNESIAKAAYNGNIGGYAWGEKFGWISLSACNGLSNAQCSARSYCRWTAGGSCDVDSVDRVPQMPSQDVNDWGVYIDFCSRYTNTTDCEAEETKQYCNWEADETQCVFDKANNQDGQPLGGYAWSQYLGWIKFTPETGEQLQFSGAFTNWFPDRTPPEFIAGDYITGNHAWIPVEGSTDSIQWDEFADEDDSYVDLIRSTITVSHVSDPSGYFGACPDPQVNVNGNLVISLGATGEANLDVPAVGDLSAPPDLGYCQYELSGALYNQTGFAHYFGPEGLTIASTDGVDTTNATTASPNTYQNEPITISIRAGDLVPASIGLSATGNDVIADGQHTVSLSFSPTDLSSNPIISVRGGLDGTPLPDPTDSDDWVRNVELLYDLSSSPYAFDSVNSLMNLGQPTPIDINTQTYMWTDNLWYPYSVAGDPGNLPHIGGTYSLDVTGYAPSTVTDFDGNPSNELTLSQIDVYTNDLELPQLSPTQGPWLASIGEVVLDDISTGGILPFEYHFNPALVVNGGELDSEFLQLDQPAEATLDFSNESTHELSEYGFDNLLHFTDEGGNSELMEVEDINELTQSTLPGRTDPNGPGTRYGLVHYVSSSLDAGNNAFHNNAQNFHEPDYVLGSGTNDNGEYDSDGEVFVSPGDDCIAAGNCPAVPIDRTDLLNANIASGASDSFTFGFTPKKFTLGASGEISFDVQQYLSYYFPHNSAPFDKNVVYHAEPQIDGYQVKSLGIDTSGTVGGQQVYDTGDRDLATVTTASSADLRRQIRRNVAVLTRNMTACASAITLSNLETDGDKRCITRDDTNGTIVAYYTGDPTDTLTLGDGTDLTIPTGYKYTLILESVDLAIESNILYPPNPSTSFGIIVLQDSDGNGGNVYIDPTPTNIVGLLYAEGSLLASPDAGGSFYYGSAAGSAGDLLNQLFWQGSIASVNTIGGASNRITPEGVDCDPWGNDPNTCAQAYDLDFLRRFTTLTDSTSGDMYSPPTYKFSGGGECFSGPPITCNLGPWPTTIDLTATNTIDVDNSKSLEATFIERDNRPVPPGFSSRGGFTSSPEIR